MKRIERLRIWVDPLTGWVGVVKISIKIRILAVDNGQDSRNSKKGTKQKFTWWIATFSIGTDFDDALDSGSVSLRVACERGEGGLCHGFFLIKRVQGRTRWNCERQGDFFHSESPRGPRNTPLGL